MQVGLETLCVIICSLMLVSVFKTGKRYVSDEEEAEFMARCRDFIRDYRWVCLCGWDAGVRRKQQGVCVSAAVRRPAAHVHVHSLRHSCLVTSAA
jgi:hypothetical protein